MHTHVSIAYAFLAGVLSFLSPCVLPLVPGYVSMLSGSAGESLAPDAGGAVRTRLVRNSLAFILGFSLVFIALGAAATSVGQVLRAHQLLLSEISGIIVILFGLHLMGWIKIGALYRDKRMRSQARGASALGAFAIGFAFAFGWTPCIGPILGAILLLAAQVGTVRVGLMLLVVYSLGLAVPFLLTTLALDRFARFYSGFRKHLHQVEVFSGALLVLVGVLLLTHRFSLISNYLASIPILNKLTL